MSKETTDTIASLAKRPSLDRRGTVYSEEKRESKEVHDGCNCAEECSCRQIDPADPEVEEQKSDLLLELAMTTAFASLTDGTPILQASAVTSYICFFALVWWIWASQVAYNVRFNNDDWLRRLFVCLQLIVFGALAAFTNDFDVFNGIQGNGDQGLLNELQRDEFASGANIAAGNERQQRLPILNSRGICIVMALSRLLLLAQYLTSLFKIYKPDDGVRRPDWRARQKAIITHVITLLLSAVCYFISFGVISKATPTVADNAVKLFLWYFPLLVEVAIHFWLVFWPEEKVSYPPTAMFYRAVTLFTVVLGGGLDHITNGFQFIVGNDSIGTSGAGLIISGAVVFLGQFALYFGLRKDEDFRHQDKRLTRYIGGILPWFFGHFPFLSAMIVMLQASAQLLQFGNIVVALQTANRFVQEFNTTLFEVRGNWIGLNQSAFPDLIKPMSDIGISVQAAIDYVSTVLLQIAQNETGTNAAGPPNAVLQYGVAITKVILQNLNADPQPGTELYERMSLFVGYTPFNFTFVNETEYNTIMQQVYVTHATPAIWFYGAAGATLVLLAMLVYLKPRPLGPYQTFQIACRLIFGVTTICLSAFDVNQGNPVIDSDGNLSGSKIWLLASRSWVLPIFAILLVIEQIIEFSAYESFRRKGLLGREDSEA